MKQASEVDYKYHLFLTSSIFLVNSFSIILVSSWTVLIWYSKSDLFSVTSFSSVFSFWSTPPCFTFQFSSYSTFVLMQTLFLSISYFFFWIMESQSAFFWLSYFSSLAMFSNSLALAYSRATIYLLWTSNCSLVQLTFFCFSFSLKISDFILLGSFYSKSFWFLSVIFLTCFRLAKDSLLPVRRKLTRVVFSPNISTNNFSCFSEMQLSRHLMCCNQGKHSRAWTNLTMPASETLLDEISSLDKLILLGIFSAASENTMIPQSPRQFLLKFKDLSEVDNKMLLKWTIPSGVIQFKDTSSYQRVSLILLQGAENSQDIYSNPSSLILLPLRLRLTSLDSIRPLQRTFTPSENSSLSSRLSLLRLVFSYTQLLRVGPMELLMKFLPRSRLTRFIAFLSICQAPTTLIWFYANLKFLRVVFCFRAIARISAPAIPMSLSSNFRVSNFLFWIIRAAKHRAPSTPKEFFLTAPSRIPRSNPFRYEFLMRSSSISDKPTSLIMLLDRFSC